MEKQTTEKNSTETSVGLPNFSIFEDPENKESMIQSMLQRDDVAELINIGEPAIMSTNNPAVDNRSEEKNKKNND